MDDKPKDVQAAGAASGGAAEGPAPGGASGEVRQKKTPEEIEAAKQAARDRAAARKAEKAAAEGGTPGPASEVAAPAASGAIAAVPAGERQKKTPEEIEAAKQAARDRAAARKAEKTAAAAGGDASDTAAAAEPTQPVDPLDELVVPGYEPLSSELKDPIRHRRIRANEVWRPVLPGQNRQRKLWALRHFTARRVLFVAAAACLVLYFFLTINHLRFHRSYPVNFPDIESRKLEVRGLGEWNDAIGNVKLKPRDAQALAELVSGFDAEAQTQASLRALRLADVIDEIGDPLVAEQARLLQEQLALVATEQTPFGRIERELRPAVDGLVDGLGNRALRKLAKIAVVETTGARRELGIAYIRQRDYELRAGYFTLADRKMPGSVLLFLSGILFVVAARLRWVFLPDSPHPQTDPLKGDERMRRDGLNRMLLFVVLGGTGLFVAVAVLSAGPARPGQVWIDYLAQQEAFKAEQIAAAKAKRDALIEKWQNTPVTAELIAASAVQLRAGGAQRLDRGLPAEFGEPLWEAPIAQTSIAAPVIWEDPVAQVAITVAGDDLEQRVIAINLAGDDAGKELWNVVVQLEGAMPPTADVYGGDDESTDQRQAFAAIAPVTDGRRVITFWPSGDLIAYDLLSGDVAWRQMLRTTEIPYLWQVSALQIVDGTVLVPLIDGGSDSGLFAYDSASGEQRWHATIPGHTWASPIVVRNADATLAIVQGEHLHAIDVASGEQAWQHDKNYESEFGSSPAASGGRIFAGVDGNGLWALDGAGTQLWEGDPDALHFADYPSFLASGDRLWSLRRDGGLSCIDAATGTSIYKAALDGEFWASPVLVGDKLLLTAIDGTVHTVSAGDVFAGLGTTPLGKPTYATPAVSHGYCVFRTESSLVAFALGSADEHRVEVAVTAAKEPVGTDTVPVVVDERPASPAIAGEGPVLIPAATDAVDPSETDFGGREWSRFRGPGGQGIADETIELPESWDLASGRNLAWGVDLDLPGMASPIVWDDKIVVSLGDGRLHELRCLKAGDGSELWRTAIPTRAGKEPFLVGGSEKEAAKYPYMYASATPSTDGERVYTLYSNGDLACVALADGAVLWARDLGHSQVPYGHSQSPIVATGRLFVSWDGKQGGQLFAFGPATGKPLWQIERADQKLSYATPIVAKTSRYGTQLVTLASNLISYSVEDGTELWRAGGFKGNVGPSPIFIQEKVYAAMARSGIWAVKVNQSGEVTGNAAWTRTRDELELPEYVCPISDGRLIWTLAGKKGTLTCMDVQNGAIHYAQDLGELHYASPVLIGKRLLLVSSTGICRWVQASTSFEVEEAGNLGEEVVASPAVGHHGIIIRTAGRLVCLRETE